MTSALIRLTRELRRGWPLAAIMIVVFLTGGASRIDVQSLVVLRPMTVVAATLACLFVTREDLIAHRGLLGCMALVFCLVAIQLVPLPPAWWHALPGRAQFASVDKLAGFGAIWRPLSLTPSNTWHSLLALIAPAAVLLVGIQQRHRDLWMVLPVLIAIGLASALLGLIQVIGDPNGPAYLYRVSRAGAGGLFANRNHAALLIAMMFPMLATWVTVGGAPVDERRRLVAAVLTGILFVPMIVVTGSRAGFLLSLFGVAAAVAIYASDHRSPAVPASRKPLPVRIAAFGVMALLLVISPLLFRGEAVQRLMHDPVSSDTRLRQWGVAVNMVRDYFPVGSGAGSIAEVYQIHEPQRLLNLYYSNHTHNEYLETAVTFGLPGVLLILLGIGVYVVRCKKLWYSPDKQGSRFRMARLGAIAIFMIAIASVADYPLRTPSMISLFAVLLLWFFEAGRADPRAGSVARGGGAG